MTVTRLALSAGLVVMLALALPLVVTAEGSAQPQQQAEPSKPTVKGEEKCEQHGVKKTVCARCNPKLAAAFTMNELCREGYFPRAGEKGDGGGFNGIGARWIARFMKDRNESSTFGPWLQKNAEAAWQARRTSDNLTWPRWPQPTPEGVRYSWGSSSAVVLLQVTPPQDPAKPENAP